MPTMIDDVKKISKDRLTNFKQYLFDFISSNRKMHQNFANQLENIQKLIEKIDPNKILNNLMKENFNNLKQNKIENEKEPSADNQNEIDE